MREAEALLFDLDGTIADTSEANFRAYACAFREAGVEISSQDFHSRSLGRNWRAFVPEILGDNGLSISAAKIAARKQSLYPQFVGDIRLNVGLLAFAAASQATMRVALVTTASTASATAVLRAHQLEHLFEVVVTGDDVQRHKPDPAAYNLAASRLGVDPAACVVFEDSEAGIASATAAGMMVVRIAW